MDFELIIESLPVAVTIWRFESDPKLDSDVNNFRLVYANNRASEELEVDLFDAIGRKLNSLPYDFDLYDRVFWLVFLV